MEPDFEIPSPLPPHPILPDPSVSFYTGKIGPPKPLPTFRQFLREWLRAALRRGRPAT